MMFGNRSTAGGMTKAVAALILGLVMLFVGNRLAVISYIVAAAVLGAGAMSLIIGFKKEESSQRPLILINFGFTVAVSVLMFAYADELGSLIVGIIGLLMLLMGLFKAFVAWGLSKLGLSRLALVMPLMMVVCGALLLFRPAMIADFVGVVVGVAFIMYGATELVSYMKTRKAMQDWERNTRPQQPRHSGSQRFEDFQEGVKDVDYEKVDEQ
jgi:uncharacterized membrane protein HdeD (DUF308 family)